MLCALGCVEEIELDLPEVAPKLVILSNFSNDAELQVSVAQTRSATATTNTPFLYFTNAEVTVWSGLSKLDDLELVLPEDEEEAPYYRAPDLQPEVGILYTVKVDVPGFEQATARSMIPRPVEIASMEFSSTIVNGRAEDEAQFDFNVSVGIADPAGEDNYYHLRFFQEFFRYRIEGMDTIINPSTLLRPSLPVNPTTDDIPFVQYSNDQGILIRDNTMDGTVGIFTFEGSVTFNNQLYLPGDFIVELRSVSEDYYRFHTSIARQQEADGPFGGDVDLSNNIDNGCGNFSGFSTFTLTRPVNR